MPLNRPTIYWPRSCWITGPVVNTVLLFSAVLRPLTVGLSNAGISTWCCYTAISKFARPIRSGGFLPSVDISRSSSGYFRLSSLSLPVLSVHRWSRPVVLWRVPTNSIVTSMPPHLFDSSHTELSQLKSDPERHSSVLLSISWWRGLAVTRWSRISINEVTLRQARLVLGWVTVWERVNHLGM